MPFSIAWTDLERPELERQAIQYWWSCRATTSPESWELNLAVIVDGAAVGITSIGATDFGIVGSVHTGSWLGRSCQGRGIGTEMRAATLHLGFAGFGAAAGDDGGVRRQRAVARRHAPARLRAERHVGEPAPRTRPASSSHFVLTREAWTAPAARRHRARRRRRRARAARDRRPPPTTWSTDGVTIDGFQESSIEVADGVALHVRTAGTAHPSCSCTATRSTAACGVSSRRRSPSSTRVVVPDLRGYGRSSTPPDDDEHTVYSKRTMARDVVAVMTSLGHERFAVVGHDRGGRVAYRTALDHPERVERPVHARHHPDDRAVRAALVEPARRASAGSTGTSSPSPPPLPRR